MNLELFKVKETAITHSDGHVTISKTTKVTGKGQQYFINLFLDGREKRGERQKNKHGFSANVVSFGEKSGNKI
jgi:hypothetical protein